MAGTHPFLLQNVAALFFEEKRTENAERVDYEHIQKEAQQNLASYFEDSWAMLDNAARQLVIESLVLAEKIARQDHWESRDSLELSNSELFRNYILSTQLLVIPPARDIGEINTSALKEALKNLHNSEKLGKSFLTGIPLITARIEQQQARSPYTRGHIVQETLKEALERMKGQGERSDRAQDWLDYNILYYCYFIQKRQMSQGLIANRLGMSERQYYQLLFRAIERLGQMLLEMVMTDKSTLEKS